LRVAQVALRVLDDEAVEHEALAPLRRVPEVLGPDVGVAPGVRDQSAPIAAKGPQACGLLPEFTAIELDDEPLALDDRAHACR
ncbi:hypothetical protein C1T14_26635, partial [Escherichia coli]